MSREQSGSARHTPLSERLRARSADAPLTIGHRGSAADCPENTLPSFRAATAAGAHMVEFDFHATTDGELVVIHDETLDRTTDSAAVFGRPGVRIAEVTAAELARLDAGSWKDPRFGGARVPTLGETLDLIQRASISLLEQKAGPPEALVALLRRTELVDEVVVSAFDWSWLEALHRLEPRITTAALGEHGFAIESLPAIARTGAAAVHWDGARLRPEDVASLHERDYLVFAYTLNTDVELLGGGAIGLDAITTDRPARLLELTAAGHVRRRA
jgi:glycerophosphoryl diester phosphodiesterase